MRGRSLSDVVHDRNAIEMDSRAHKAVAFLEDMLQEELPNNDLSEALQNGVILCKLMLHVLPGCIKRYNPDPKLAFKMMENCILAVEVCKSFGLSVNFLPQDLYNKVNLDRIVDLILDVSEPKFRHSVIALKPQSISRSNSKMQMSRTASLMKMLKPSSSQQVTKVPEARQDGRETPKQRASKVITFSQVVREAKKENAVATRAFVIDELVKTEREYVKHLDILEFMNPMKGLLRPETTRAIFSSIKNIMITNKKLLQALNTRVAARNSAMIGDVLSDFASELNYYATYCNNLESASLNLERSRRESEDLNSFLEQAEFTQQCNFTNLSTLLVKPLARIAKYPILIKDIITSTEEQHPDYQNLSIAFDAIQAVVNTVQEARQRSDNLHKILEIKHSLSGCEKFQGWDEPRMFIREGDFTKFTKQSQLKRHCFLFNDVIIYTTVPTPASMFRKENTMYTYKGTISFAYCRYENVPDSKDIKNAFCLTTLNGKKKKFLLSANTLAEKAAWAKDINNLIAKARHPSSREIGSYSNLSRSAYHESGVRLSKPQMRKSFSDPVIPSYRDSGIIQNQYCFGVKNKWKIRKLKKEKSGKL